MEKTRTRRITNKEFVRRVREVNLREFGTEYEYIFKDEYKGMKTKIKVKHCNDSCGFEYEVRPGEYLRKGRGSRCPKCSRKRRLTTEDFSKEVEDETGGEYKVLGEYKTALSKIRMEHKSKRCGGYVFDMTPNAFKNGTRCPKCFGTPKKTTEIFKNEVMELLGEEYEVLGDYVDNKTKIKMKHKNEMCGGYEYEVAPNVVLSGRGSRCKKCFGQDKYTTEWLKEEVRKVHNNEYEVLGEYTGRGNKIRVRHNSKKCGNREYEVSLSSILSGVGCSTCKGNKLKTTEEFKDYVNKTEGESYSVIGSYTNNKTKIKMRHNSKKCGENEYYVTPVSFIHGVRCPKCRYSKGEMEVERYLIQGGYNYEGQYKLVYSEDTKSWLRADFVIKGDDGNVTHVIEFDGVQHYEPVELFGGEKGFKETLERDLRKNTYCKLSGIKMVRIPYKNIEEVGKILNRELKIETTKKER